MKIITPGTVPSENPPAWWEGMEIDCPKCGCLFKLEKGDAVETFQARTPGARPVLTVSCPTCGRKISKNQPDPTHV